MKLNRIALLVVASLVCASLSPTVLRADELVGRSQFRRTVDPSERSTTGSLVLRKKNNLQIAEYSISHLGEDSFAIYFGPYPTPPFEEANYDKPLYGVISVAPISRKSIEKGSWFTRLIATNEAPLLIPLIDDLSAAAGHRFEIGRIDDNQLIIGVTNVVGTTTNIIQAIPVPLQDRTNTVSSSMWAPAPVLSANPSANSYHRRADLATPAVPPAPGAKGTVDIRYYGSSGRSVIDIRISKIPAGQKPHVFISDLAHTNAYNLIDAGEMTVSGKKARFIRDTKFGDPLPQQVIDSGDLSGRVIQVLDLNGAPPFVYLEGEIP